MDVSHIRVVIHKFNSSNEILCSKNENIINDDEILKTHRVEIENESQKQFKEEYQKEIVCFLKEKGFGSFEELSKCNPFLTEEELIQEILNYHKKAKGEINE